VQIPEDLSLRMSAAPIPNSKSTPILGETKVLEFVDVFEALNLLVIGLF
jgi:hypothetical protein